MSEWWVEQRYVFLVEAPTFKDAEGIAFRKRALIATECGPVTTRPHGGLMASAERQGWDECEPYRGGSDAD